MVKTVLLYSGIFLGVMAISAMAGNPGTVPAVAKPGSKVAAGFKKQSPKASASKVSPSPGKALVRRATPVTKPPASRKIATAASPAAAKKVIPATVKAPPRARSASAVKTVAACAVKKPPLARVAVTKPPPAAVIGHDPGEYIDISYPPRPRAKVPVLAAARLPRR